ncbi:uncharacterized protein [Parasteatoda tepidariorum]|uniref:uncharacterized protein isoform X1 n=2 Tax=Parasteatoda tepidariorum TaxID=114398 RepID=UPI00077FA281|nr:uncharacterized protein LOC107454233 isoform X1 [Parasteatoda tepidariorum]
MASMQRDHWSHVWLRCLLLSLFLCRNVVLPEVNKNLQMSSLCLSKSEPTSRSENINGGAVLTSKNELNMKCVVTFSTDTILQRFMLRFEHLALDCNDHLYIFDGGHEYGNHEFDLSCRSTRTDVGTIFTSGSYVTLKYITDARSHAGNGFKLIMTAVKKPNAACQAFRCLNDLCISQDLRCDGINHCGDNSDETSQALCGDETATNQIMGLNFGTFVSLVLGTFLLCCVCIVGVIICVFRKEQQQRQLETEAQFSGTPHSMVIGQQPYSTQPTFSTSQLQEKPPPYPGNMFLHQSQQQLDGTRGGVYYHAK